MATTSADKGFAWSVVRLARVSPSLTFYDLRPFSTPNRHQNRHQPPALCSSLHARLRCGDAGRLDPPGTPRAQPFASRKDAREIAAHFSGGAGLLGTAYSPDSRLGHFFFLCAVDGFSACSAEISAPLSSM